MDPWPQILNEVVADDSTEDIVAVTSQDGGQTFSNPGIVRTIVPGRQNPPVGFNRNRYNDFPRITASDMGRIFITFQDARVAGNQGIGGNDSILPSSIRASIAWRIVRWPVSEKSHGRRRSGHGRVL
ncbi:MAG TPA: hypothetical protein VFE98_00240 [Candidatus Bathyarchaeia archaeon]|nr:hypothetical protein [Candidatus Bathyarchaeia archaeon]